MITETYVPEWEKFREKIKRLVATNDYTYIKSFLCGYDINDYVYIISCYDKYRDIYVTNDFSNKCYIKCRIYSHGYLLSGNKLRQNLIMEE